MNVDVLIAEIILGEATEQDLPVLCVHDSFIVDYRKTKLLKDLMASASKAVVGQALPIAGDWMGWDEVPEDRRDDFEEVRYVEPTRGSRERQAMFEQAVLKDESKR